MRALRLLEHLGRLPTRGSDDDRDRELEDARAEIWEAVWLWDRLALQAASTAQDYLVLQSAGLEAIALLILRKAL